MLPSLSWTAPLMGALLAVMISHQHQANVFFVSGSSSTATSSVIPKNMPEPSSSLWSRYRGGVVEQQEKRRTNASDVSTKHDQQRKMQTATFVELYYDVIQDYSGPLFYEYWEGDNSLPTLSPNCYRSADCTNVHDDTQERYSLRFNKNHKMKLKSTKDLTIEETPQVYEQVKFEFWMKAILTTDTSGSIDYQVVLDISEDGGTTWQNEAKIFSFTQGDFQNNQGIYLQALFDTPSSSTYGSDTFKLRMYLKNFPTFSDIVHVDSLKLSAVLYEEPEDEPPIQEDEGLVDVTKYCPVGRKRLGSTDVHGYVNTLDGTNLGTVSESITHMTHSKQTFTTYFHKVGWIGSSSSSMSTLPEVTAVDLDTGLKICTYTLEVPPSLPSEVSTSNFESLSLGPCTSTSGSSSSCLYLSNTDVILKFNEPNINMACPTTSTSVAAIPFTLSSSSSDGVVSAMFVDTTGGSGSTASSVDQAGDIYLITKASSTETASANSSQIYKISVSQHETLSMGNVVTPSISLNPIEDVTLPLNNWNDADMSLDGHLITLRDPYFVYFFSRSNGQTLSNSFGHICEYSSKSDNTKINRMHYESLTLISASDESEYWFMEISNDEQSLHNQGELKLRIFQLLSSDNYDFETSNQWEQLVLETFDFSSESNEHAFTTTSSATPIVSTSIDPYYGTPTYTITSPKSLELTGTDETTIVDKVNFRNNGDQLLVKCSFYVTGFTSSDQYIGLDASYNNGGAWWDIKEWKYGETLVNDVPYVKELIILDHTIVPNSGAMKFRLRMGSISGTGMTNDIQYLYVDEIEIFKRDLIPLTTSGDVNVPQDSTLVKSQYCPIGRETQPAQTNLSSQGSLTDELSYLAYSQQTLSGSDHGIVWSGSDGDATTIMAFDSVTGDLVCQYDIVFPSTPLNDNWESMSLGPCDSSSTSNTCLYLGNTGNNGARNCVERICTGSDADNDYQEIYKVEEPNVNTCGAGAVGGSLNVGTIIYDYFSPDMPTDHADCDAMFVDVTGSEDVAQDNAGDIYLITKNRQNGNHLQRVVKIPVSVHETLVGGSTVSTTVEVVTSLRRGYEWEGADMSQDGTLIALRDNEHVYFFPRPVTGSTSLGTTSWSMSYALGGTNYCDYVATSDRNDTTRRSFEAVALKGNLMENTQTLYEVSECGSANDNCHPDLMTYKLLGSTSAVTQTAWESISSEKFDGTAPYKWSTGTDATTSTSVKQSGTKSLKLSNVGTTTLQQAIGATTSSYNQLLLTFSFMFKTTDIIENEDHLTLYVSFDNGTTWLEYRKWRVLRGIIANTWYVNEPVYIDDSWHPFSNTMLLKLESNADIDDEGFYIDDITIQGRYVGTTPTTGGDSIYGYDTYYYGGGGGGDVPTTGGGDSMYNGGTGTYSDNGALIITRARRHRRRNLRRE